MKDITNVRSICNVECRSDQFLLFVEVKQRIHIGKRVKQKIISNASRESETHTDNPRVQIRTLKLI